jgi:type I restriction enzyme S subunit
MKTLDDAADFLSGGTPRKSIAVFWGGDIPWYSASNMDERFLGDTDVTITNEGLDAGSRIAPAGSTLILVRGSGLFNYVPICFAKRNVAFNQDVKALVPKKGVDPIFLHFWVESLRADLNENIGTTGIGAGKFDTDFLKALPFPDIDYDEQVQRGVLASVFDRKIDFLRDMNRKLEELALSLFRAWFVDFEPVRAKAAGATSFRGMPQPLFDQLPDSFTASEVGDIPTGWTLEPLGEILELSYGKSLPATKRMPGDVAVYGSGGLTGTHSEKLIDGPAVIIGRKGTIGSVYWEDADVFPIDTVFYLTPKRFSLLFLYQLLLTLPLTKMNTDAAVPGLNRNNAYRLKVFLPPNKIAEHYSAIISPLWTRRKSNLDAIATLTALRDTLLPKLISGELPTPDLEALGLTATEQAEASNGG